MTRRVSIIIASFLLTLPTLASATRLPTEANDELTNQVLQSINDSRKGENLPPLSFSDAVSSVAQSHVDDTASHFDPSTIDTREASYLAHTSSDGRNLAQRYSDAGVQTGWGYAENAGYWTRAPFGTLPESAGYGLRLIHEGMMAEVPPNDSHRENILGPYTHIGIGLSLFDEAEAELNAIFLVTNFSRYSSQEEEIAFRESLKHLVTSPRSLFGHAAAPEHEGPFIDVKPDDEYAVAISTMKEQGFLQGYEDGSFRSGDSVSRAEIVKMLLNVVGISPIGREFNQCFTDVFNQWHAPYVCLAKREGWIKGYEDGSFRPGQDVTRAEGITLVARILGIERKPGSTPVSFRDVPPGIWYEEPAMTLSDWQFLPFENVLYPEQGFTRGEVAEVLYRSMSPKSDEEDISVENPKTSRNLQDIFEEEGTLSSQ